MKTKILYTLIMLLSMNVLAAQDIKWEPLFNGKDLKGWKRINGTAEYRVEGDAIVGTTKTGTPNTFLVTERNYGDFILEFDFKVDDGINSGVQIRSESRPDYMNGTVHGYQFEIDPAPRAWTGGIYDESRRGWLYPLTFNPQAGTAFKNGQWNKARIEAIGNSIRTWVNGVPCSNLWDDMTPTGFIGLQVHGIGNDKSMEGKTVSWRNVRICTTDPGRYATPDKNEIPQVNTTSNILSPREKAEGWTLLWDGKSNKGWRSHKSAKFPEKGWVIENGVLKVVKGDGGESTNGGDIITDRKYRNFMLAVDFRITDGANSGIKYFVDPDLNQGAGSSIGCEFQILDDQRHPDAKLGVKGNRKLGSLYDLIPAPDSKFVKGGAFNTALIIVRGNHVEHWLNGQKIIEYERNNQMWDALVAYSKYSDWPAFGNAAEGHILLQDHGDEVWFKNIKIKELP